MTMKYRILLCSLFCLCAVTVLRAERVDMLKAGAKVDGKTLNTKPVSYTHLRAHETREPLCCFLIASMIIFPLWRCVMRE